MSQDKFFLKDKLFNSSKITQLANEIQRVYNDFQKENFVKEIMIALPTLELKQRISHITKCLYNFLPQDYPRAIETFQQMKLRALDKNYHVRRLASE